MPTTALATPDSPRPHADLVEDAWLDVLDTLPDNLDEMAREEFGFHRRGQIQTGADVLRLCMAYGVLDLSLRSTAAWLASRRLGDISDVAVLGRLRRSWPFLGRLLGKMLEPRLRFEPAPRLKYRVRVIDATCLSAPGAEGAEWRVHATYDVARGGVGRVGLTDEKGGEQLGRASAGPGEILVADRGYAHASRVAEVREAGGHVLVRVGHSAVPLVDAAGAELDPLAYARRKRPRAGRPRRVESTTGFLRDDAAREFPVRLVVVRKTAEATRLARKKATKESRKKGKKPRQRTLDAAAFVFLLTTLPREEADDVTVAELYRVRWQVELAFKRWKSIFDLDRLRAFDPDLARAYILAKLIAATIADTLARQARAFSPWGVRLAPLHMAHPRAG